MKILLVYPGWPKQYWPRGAFRSYWVPTGLAHIAAVCRRAGCEVRVHVREEQLIKNQLDWAGTDQLLQRELREFHPDIVGLSVVTPALSDARRIAQQAKRICGDSTLVVAGGVHPSALPEQTMAECPAVDVVAVGEGEATMMELARAGPRADVPGLVYRGDGSFVRTAPRSPAEDLDRLGMPAYELFDMKFYTRPNRWMIRWLKLRGTNVRSSRGCPSRCRFCAGHAVAGVGVRFHSIEHVIEQIRYLVANFGVEAVHFDDDTLGADRERLVALCRALRRSGLSKRIRWDGCLRVDQVEPELLAEMKAAGCIQVEYGFETASDAALKALGKNTSVQLNRGAVELTRRAGLRIFADVMIGLPGETEADVRATLRFLRWARPEVIGAGCLTPLPGTPLFDRLPQPVRDRLVWDAYTYMNYFQIGVNLSAMPDERFGKVCRRFIEYLARPHNTWAVLRDSGPDEAALRRRLRRKLLRFALLHPIHAARLPW